MCYKCGKLRLLKDYFNYNQAKIYNVENIKKNNSGYSFIDYVNPEKKDLYNPKSAKNNQFL